MADGSAHISAFHTLLTRITSSLAVVKHTVMRHSARWEVGLNIHAHIYARVRKRERNSRNTRNMTRSLVLHVMRKTIHISARFYNRHLKYIIFTFAIMVSVKSFEPDIYFYGVAVFFFLFQYEKNDRFPIASFDEIRDG